MNLQYDKMVGGQGHYLTQALFYEYRFQSKSDYIPFTLKDKDWRGHLSAYKIYMASATEYEAAITMLNSWKHWEHLCQAPFFAKEVAKWREEREIRDAAMAKAVMIEKVKEGDLSASRSLYEIATKRKAGRPSKLEVESEKKKQAAIDNKVSSIIERMANK